MKIRGNTVGTTMPRSNLEQTDPKKADFVHGRDAFMQECVGAALAQASGGLESLNVGANNIISLKGYFFTAIDKTTNQLTISMKQDKTDTDGLEIAWEPGDVVSMKNGSWYGYCSTIKSIEGNVITVDTIPFDKISTGKDFDDRTIVVPDKPVSGQVDLCRYASSLGYNSSVHTKGGFNAGGNNRIGPSGGNGATIGSELEVTASNTVAMNYKNKNHADNSLVGGMSNNIYRTSGSSIVLGYLLKLYAKYCAVFGQSNVLHENAHNSLICGRGLVGRGAAQATFGQYNLDDNDSPAKLDQNSYVVVGGGTSSARKTIFRVKRDGNTDVCSNKIVNLAPGTTGADAVNMNQLAEKFNAANTALTNHTKAKNPHGITPEAIGAPVDTALGTDADLNTVVKSGMYRLGGSVKYGNVSFNAVANGQLLVIRGGEFDTITQIAFPYNASRMWLRSGNSSDVGGGGSWTAWKEITETAWSSITGKPAGFLQWHSYEIYNFEDFYRVNLEDLYIDDKLTMCVFKNSNGVNICAPVRVKTGEATDNMIDGVCIRFERFGSYVHIARGQYTLVEFLVYF